jgi:hypothetical protein
MVFAAFMAAVVLLAAVLLQASATRVFVLGWLIVLAVGLVALRVRRRTTGPG